MQIGSFTIDILSEGRFEIFDDGHINRISVSKENQSQTQTDPEKENISAIVGINPILVKTDMHNILLDAGLGWGLDEGSEYSDVSNVQTNLNVFGLAASDITHVILSHLHYDHAAGCTYNSSDFSTRATFPNATYYLHQKEWEHALTRVGQDQNTRGADYKLDEFYRLIADDKVQLLKEDYNEILEGIAAIRTGGHTPGHQVVLINDGDNTAYYLGDLLPSSDHLNRYGMSGIDVHAIRAKKEKIHLLRQASDDQAMLLFYHSQNARAGRLIRDEDKKYILADIPEH